MESLASKLRTGVVCASAAEMEQLGTAIMSTLPENSWLGLSGDLGVGKTTLVRGMARALGITQNVTSPTYNIFTIYTGRWQLVHMDAYRLTDAGSMEALMIEEFLRPPYLIVLEWPENIAAFLPQQMPHLKLSILPDHRRLVLSENF